MLTNAMFFVRMGLKKKTAILKNLIASIVA